jgi:hypothetical protein
VPQTQKKSYIAIIQDKWPYPVIGHPIRSTYQENCSGVMLTFRPSGRFRERHAFCARKMENQIFMKQSLKPHLEELFKIRSCTYLPSLDALSLCMLMFCDLQGHLGGKA